MHDQGRRFKEVAMTTYIFFFFFKGDGNAESNLNKLLGSKDYTLFLNIF